MPPEYFKAKREEAHVQAVKDSLKITSHLLEDIHDESLSVPEERPPELTVARTMARFSSLLFNLSKQGADTAGKNLETAEINLKISKLNLKLQKWLIALTVIALILTFLAVLLAFLQFKK
jgi:hypothetical protein